MEPVIDHVTDAGSPGKNEDLAWIGADEDLNIALILDGTSGTAGDFGAKEGQTGGQRYVRKFGENIQDILSEEPEKPLEEALKQTLSRMWDEFQEDAEEATESYLDGEDKTYPRADTVPGAVGSIVRWSDQRLEVFHVGDVETHVVREDGKEQYSNETHERFDGKLNREIERAGEVNTRAEQLVDDHRAASNLPGTYPQLVFNPLAVEKLGEKHVYRIENVQRVLLSTDGATTRMKKLFDMDNEEVLAFTDEHGIEDALEKLREKEQKTEVAELKQSDDAAMIDIRF